MGNNRNILTIEDAKNVEEAEEFYKNEKKSSLKSFLDSKIFFYILLFIVIAVLIWLITNWNRKNKIKYYNVVLTIFIIFNIISLPYYLFLLAVLNSKYRNRNVDA